MSTSIPKGPWQLEAGREIVTPDGRFYLSYDSKQRHPPPVGMDRIAKAVAHIPDMLKALDAAILLLKIHSSPADLGAERFDLRDCKQMKPIFDVLDKVRG